VIILSGGKGTRVKKYTSKIPKCLIKVNGKPFLYHQLKYLKKYKVKNILISSGYLGEKINLYVKNHINFLNVKVVNDGKKLLGTGGAVVNSLKYLKKNFFIIYGDSYLNFNLKKMVNKRKLAIMAIYKNKDQYDKSNIILKKTNKILYIKNKKNKNLFYIDYGVSYINKKIFKGLKKNERFELSDFYEMISQKNKLSSFKVKKRFYEIGSYKGIKDIKNYLK
tara:strand:+ start:68 stop:733 length:666 start_codon:yes stop_codon:yes gene_type:complete